MGTERTETNYVKYFSTVAYAKKYAEEEYNRLSHGKKIKWVKEGIGATSGDLLFVKYDIEVCKVQI